MKHEQEQSAPESGESGLKLLVALILAVLLIAGAAAAFIPNIHGHRHGHGNEAAAIGALRTITTAQAIFRESDRNQDKLFDYGELTDLGKANLIDTVLSAGTKQGYRFTVVRGSDGFTNSEYLWWAAAEPVLPGETGDRYFFTNQGGVIYFSNTAPIRPIPGSQDNSPADATRLGGR